MALVLLFAFVLAAKALLIAHGAPRNDLSPDAWQAWPAEVTSFLGLLVALPVAAAIHRLRNAEISRSFLVAGLLLGALLFSIIHVSATIALREILRVRLGEAFAYSLARDWPSVLLADLAACFVCLAVLAVMDREQIPEAEPAPFARVPEGDEARPASVELPDGGRILNVDISDLRAVLGGGNYVELMFGNGGRRMLRATLARTEAALSGHGFRRTHKSWLVRVSAIRALDRTAAGDFTVDLGDALTAPLSRRQRAVIEEVRREVVPS